MAVQFPGILVGPSHIALDRFGRNVLYWGRRSILFDKRPNELNEAPSSGGAPQSPHSSPRVLCIFLLRMMIWSCLDAIRATLEFLEACVR